MRVEVIKEGYQKIAALSEYSGNQATGYYTTTDSNEKGIIEFYLNQGGEEESEILFMRLNTEGVGEYGEEVNRALFTIGLADEDGNQKELTCQGLKGILDFQRRNPFERTRWE